MVFIAIRLNRLIAGAAVLMLCIGVVAWAHVTYQHGGGLLPAQTTPTAPSDKPPVVPETAESPIDLVEEAKKALGPLLEARAEALRTGNAKALKPLYNTSIRTGLWAYEHQERRVKYVSSWAAKRGVQFIDSKTNHRITNAKKRANSVWLYVIESSSMSYVYKDDPMRKVNTFGIGTRHVMELMQLNGKWVFKLDWFTDPLDEENVPDVAPALIEDIPDWAHSATVLRRSQSAATIPYLVTDSLAEVSADESLAVASSAKRYNRAAAVAYADKYCGAAMGCGNNNRYNQKYHDYAGLGGDCTNFVSQVLGDPAAGNLPKTASWRTSKKGGGGESSRAWVQADAFATYLTNSGKAQRIARAKYPKVMQPSASHPQGLIGTLMPGDMIGYQEKGDVVHFSIVTAKDSRGVPLVNSHTADRYHVPWDLGWDRNTYYLLYRIRD